jgi:hypothetical protein
MKLFLIILFTLFACYPALAQNNLLPVQADILEGNENTPNFIKNSECRVNTNDISVSGAGTKTKDITDPIGQTSHCRLDAAASGETFTFTTKNLPSGYLNGNCEVSFRYAAGDSLYKAYALNADGVKSNEYTVTGSGSVLPNGDPVKFYLPCGSGDETTVKAAPTLIIESTSASAIGIDVSNVQSTGLRTIQPVPSVSEEIDGGTISFTATTTPPSKPTVRVSDKVTYIRVGKFAHITYKWDVTSATGSSAGAGTYLLSLPSGLVADTSYIGTPTGAATDAQANLAVGLPAQGQWRSTTSSSAFFINHAVLYSTTQLAFVLQQRGGTGNGLWGSGTLPLTEAMEFTLTVRVPIQGWSASVSAAAANQTDYGWVDGGTVTVTGTTTNPTKGTIVRDKIWYSRRGQNLQVRIEFQQSSAGGAGSGDYLFQIPTASGCTIDSNYTNFDTTLGTNSQTAPGSLGVAGGGRAAAEGLIGYVLAYNSTNVRLILRTTASATQQAIGSGYLPFSNTAMNLSANFIVPCVGWAENQRAPTLVGSVTSNSLNALRIETAYFTNTGTPAVSTSSSSWLGTLTDNGVGDTTVNFISGTFSSAPVCTATASSNTNIDATADIYDAGTPATASLVRVRTLGNGRTPTDMAFRLICVGPR